MAFNKIFPTRGFRNAAAISHLPNFASGVVLSRQESITNTGVVNITKDVKTSTWQYTVSAATGFYNSQKIFDSSLQGFEGRELQIMGTSGSIFDSDFYVKINHDESAALTPNTSGVLNMKNLSALQVYKVPVGNVVIQGTGSTSYPMNFIITGNPSEQANFNRGR